MTSQAKNLLTAGLVATLTVSVPVTRAREPAAPGTNAPAERPQLQLSVDVPSLWRPFLADDLAEAFASHVSDVFHRRGYAGQVNFLGSGDPAPAGPLVAIRLINWRIGRTETAECTFTASVTAGGRWHDLGVFGNTSLTWIADPGRWGLAEALGDAADGALRDLAVRLAKADLVPGFPPAKT